MRDVFNTCSFCCVSAVTESFMRYVTFLLQCFYFLSLNPPHRAYDVYQKVGYNCFIAAAMYVVCGLFSCCQMKLNKKKVS